MSDFPGGDTIRKVNVKINKEKGELNESNPFNRMIKKKQIFEIFID